LDVDGGKDVGRAATRLISVAIYEFRKFWNRFTIFYHLYEFLCVYQNYFQVDLSVPLIKLKKFQKIIFRHPCSILGRVLEIDNKFNLSYKEHSNFYIKTTT
jgi:hypothetical protein